MSKYCPITGESVIYLSCQDCDDKICRANQEKMEQKSPVSKTLCFTGPRPSKLYGYVQNEYNELVDFIRKSLISYIKDGYDAFISGGAQGFDQIAFWAVNGLKKDYPHLKNILYLPCKNQDSRWIEEGTFGKKTYRLMLKHADKVVYVHDRDYQSPKDLFDRNHAMVDDADSVFGMYPNDNWTTETKSGTAECLRYANKKGKPITRLAYDNHKHYHLTN